MDTENSNKAKNNFKLSLIVLLWSVISILIFYIGVSLVQIGTGNSPKSNPKPVGQVEEKKNKDNQTVKIDEKKEVHPKETSKQPGFLKQLPLGEKLYNFFIAIFKPEKKKVEEVVKVEKKIVPKKIAEDTDFVASTWFSDYSAMKDNVQYYNEIHPFIYGMQGRHNNNGKLVSHWGSKNKLARIKELRELNPSIKIIPTIFRWENKGEKISENIGMNGRKDIRDLHIKYILEEVDTYNYDGIDIDYEGMTCDKKEKFEEFIVILSKELKKRNKILSVAVHPKTPSKYTRTKNCKGKNLKMDFQENWRGPLTHDYKFLGKYADRVKIMAYELHPRKYHNPGPGPQGPNVWLENIIEYAITRVPNKKLFMAIPTYGYDWALNCKSRAKAVYYSTALKIQSKKHKFYQPTDVEEIFNRHAGRSKSWRNMGKFMDIHRDKVYEDPSLWYTEGGCDRVAFFMNRKAFEKKMELLRSYNLAGFSFWQLLSDNDPGINKYLSLLLTNQVPPIPIAERKIEMLENREREKIASAQEPKKKGNREKKQIKN